MMDTDTEAMYLARGDQDVSVDSCPNRQDVRDGIRFLHKQYLRKKPGVILNEPDRYASVMQTVLFINSVRQTMDRATLVLCDEGQEQKWLDHFVTWTDMGNGVTTDTTNPFSNSASIYISPLSEMGKYYSRDWSVLVVDSEIVHKEILKDKICVQFKIWITCVNVKENLNLFSQLYKWLYPKETFDANLFKSSTNNPYDNFSKETMLESFMHNIVLKSGHICGENIFMPSSPSQKVTRKNKDATGTKIKRTKRNTTVTSTNDDTPNKVNKTDGTSSVEENSFNIGETVSDVSTNRSFITTSDTTVTSSTTNIDSKDEITENYQRDANREMSNSKNSSDLETDVFAEENNHNDEISVKNYSYLKTDITTEDDPNNKDVSIQSDDNNSNNLLLQFDEESTPLVIDETKSSDNEYDRDTQINEHDNVQYFNQSKTDINEIETKITDTKSNLNEDIDSKSILTDNAIKNNEIIQENKSKESENLFSTESISDLNKTKDELNKNKINNEEEVKNIEDVKIKTDSKIDSSGVEHKMKQMEELTLKKFKGSLLDSLF